MKNMHKYGSYVQWLQVGARIVQTLPLPPLHPLYICTITTFIASVCKLNGWVMQQSCATDGSREQLQGVLNIHKMHTFRYQRSGCGLHIR